MDRKIIVRLAAVLLIAGSGGAWLSGCTSDPPIKIASGPEGGEYYKFGEELEKRLESKEQKRPAENKETVGTIENLTLLKEGKVDLALLQSIVFPSTDIGIIAPLYHEPVVILAKKESAIQSVYDLENRHVCTGPKLSGTKETSDTLLEFYGLDVKRIDESFTAESSNCEAGIIVMGLRSPNLRRMAATGAVRFLELPYVQALAQSEAYTTEFTIPEAMFARNPSVPGRTIHTFAYTALLAVNSEKIENSQGFINEILDTIYTTDIRMDFPDLIPLKEVRQWSDLPLHQYAREYYNPLRRMEVFANRMEAWAGAKDLLFAFLAAFYFIWLQIHECRKRKERRHRQEMKDRIDEFLKNAITLDQKQAESDSPEELNDIMRQVKDLKKEAINELTEERLPSDQMFSIFLRECHNVVRKIQNKLRLLQYSEQQQPID
ncbi:MAG: TAXI family TRAP transporter solute-binding subunit [Candidatus Electrothrix sp. YB6]